MVLTEELFYECTNKGCINHYQCDILEVPYSIKNGLILKKGWKANIIGKEYSEQLILEFKKAKEKTKNPKVVKDKIKSKPKVKREAKDINDGFVFNKKHVGKSWIEIYKSFLNSKYWKQVKSIVLQRDNFTCRGCGSKVNLEVHHLTYKNHYKEHEHLDDLATLCRNCHELSHAKL